MKFPRPLPRPLPPRMVAVEMDGVTGYSTLKGCGKELSGRQIATWSRPTTAHYFSRLYLYCDACFKRLCVRGLPDYFHGPLETPLPCGARVIGHWQEKDGLLRPDYFPIESPRLFGLRVHGGAMAEHYEQIGQQA